jgi:hypothetical protein
VPINQELLRWIQARLAQPGKMQVDLAKALGIDPASVTRMVRGKRRLRVDEIEPAAAYLGIQPPAGYGQRNASATQTFFEVSPELHKAVMARAMDLDVTPDEFAQRALRAALLVCGRKIGRDRY